MEADKPSRTLLAHLGKDGYSHIHYDSDQARTISVREAGASSVFPGWVQILRYDESGISPDRQCGSSASGTSLSRIYSSFNVGKPATRNFSTRRKLTAWGLGNEVIIVRSLKDSDLGLFAVHRPTARSKQRAININSNLAEKLVSPEIFANGGRRVRLHLYVRKRRGEWKAIHR